MKRLMSSSLAAVLLGAALLAAPSRATAEPARIVTFSQSVDLALEKNPQVRLARAQIAAAEARLRSTRKLRYPVLAADANVFLWDKELAFELGGMMLPPGFDTKIRDRITSTLTVTLTQPLSGLILLGAVVGV